MKIEIDYVADFPTCSDVGLVRQKNEDNCGYDDNTPNGKLFVVCDGMGGHVGGATASKIAVESIIERIKKTKYPNARQALNDALVFANAQVLGTAGENPELKGMGTTACVVLIQGEEAWIAHAGDSRIYLYVGKEKHLHRITTDHSYVQKVLVEQEGMSEEEAEAHPKKNIILNALGIKSDFKPEVASKPILPGKDDIFLICSDGLTGMVNDPTIENVLQKTTALDDKVFELIDLAKKGGGKDNITAQLIQVLQSPHKESVYVDKNPEWRKKRTPKAITKMEGNKNLIIALVAAVLVLGLIVGGYYSYLNNSKDKINKDIDKLEEQKANIIRSADEAKREFENANKAFNNDSTNFKLSRAKVDAEKKNKNAESKLSDTTNINTQINSLHNKL